MTVDFCAIVRSVTKSDAESQCHIIHTRREMNCSVNKEVFVRLILLPVQIAFAVVTTQRYSLCYTIRSILLFVHLQIHVF